jgi:hypothetical protein
MSLVQEFFQRSNKFRKTCRAIPGQTSFVSQFTAESTFFLRVAEKLCFPDTSPVQPTLYVRKQALYSLMLCYLSA